MMKFGKIAALASIAALAVSQDQKQQAGSVSKVNQQKI